MLHAFYFIIGPAIVPMLRRRLELVLVRNTVMVVSIVDLVD
jgi:hypothetical protein